MGITKPGKGPKVYDPISRNPHGQAVFLDSGSTLTSLPTRLFKAIGRDFPTATFDSGFYGVDCAVADQDGTVDFGFGNIIIHVPYREIIWHIPGSSACILGIVADDKEPILGGE
jgi:hypothetical protein